MTITYFVSKSSHLGKWEKVLLDITIPVAFILLEPTYFALLAHFQLYDFEAIIKKNKFLYVYKILQLVFCLVFGVDVIPVICSTIPFYWTQFSWKVFMFRAFWFIYDYVSIFFIMLLYLWSCINIWNYVTISLIMLLYSCLGYYICYYRYNCHFLFNTCMQDKMLSLRGTIHIHRPPGQDKTTLSPYFLICCYQHFSEVIKW